VKSPEVTCRSGWGALRPRTRSWCCCRWRSAWLRSTGCAAPTAAAAASQHPLRPLRKQSQLSVESVACQVANQTVRLWRAAHEAPRGRVLSLDVTFAQGGQILGMSVIVKYHAIVKHESGVLRKRSRMGAMPCAFTVPDERRHAHHVPAEAAAAPGRQ
jgi:hypothetical protein